jgi:hypothetical protein
MASKFLCSGDLFRKQQPSINAIQNLPHPCPRVPLIGKLSSLAATRPQISYKSLAKYVLIVPVRSAGFFARHLRVAPFRREEPLRQFFQVFVFFQLIFQFVRILRVTR